MTARNEITGLDAQMNAAVKCYSELSGMPVSEILAKCADLDSVIARNVMMLMFAAS